MRILSTADLAGLVAAVASMPAAADDVDRIDRIRHLEQLKSAIAAAQALDTAAFAASQRAAQAVLGVPAQRQNRGIASQVALARSVSTHAAQKYTGWCSILVRELPQTFTALRTGRTSEWRAMLVARETMFLSREDRAVVDTELAPQLASMSDRAVEGQARQAAYRLDPHGSLERSRNAAADRRVTIRPAPDTMARLSALLPVAQGVACYASLSKASDTARSSGDPKGRGQVMADALVERLTGQTTADAVPVEVELIVDIDTLFTDPPDDGERSERPTTADNGPREPEQPARKNEPAKVLAPGVNPIPIPAGHARDLVRAAPTTRLRRLFSRPRTGELLTMETTARLFTEAQRDFLRLRDQYCAMPGCGAPIRHADHITPASRGGPTAITNGRGLCEACNHAIQAPGWSSAIEVDGSTTITTPTGHQYQQPPPRPFARPAPKVSNENRSVRASSPAA